MVIRKSEKGESGSLSAPHQSMVCETLN